MIVRSDRPPLWEQVDEICEQMRCAWEEDSPQRVEEWLPRYPDVAAEQEAVFDLIYTEYLLDEPQQGTAAVDGLCQRFPAYVERLRRQVRVHEALQRTVDHHNDPTVAGGAAPLPMAPASMIGKFRIDEELGRGGMGIVYRAHDTQLQRDVALKVLKSGELADEFEVRRFENEMAAAASLDHPHIVPVLEVDRHADRPYLVMKLIRGGSLARRLREFTGQPRRCAEFLLPIARAVQHMHLQGILHRDLKPSNILIDHSGQPQVTDFGLARADRGTSQLTASGDVLGTLPYLAPELVEQSSQASSVLSDVYGLGALLYTLLTGKWPRDATTPAEIIRQITSQSVPPPRRVDPAIPRDLQTICLKALERRPADRYQSAGDLADELQRYVEGRPIEARPVGTFEASWKWVRRKPWSAALTGLLAALTIALVAVSTVSTWRIRGLNSSLEVQLESARQAQAEARQAQSEAERSQADAEAQARLNRNLAYAADLRLASVAYHSGDSHQAREILNRYLPTDDNPEDLRGFEWHLLRNRIERPFVSLGETGEAGYFIAISPDGRSVAVGGQSGRITIYDAATQSVLRDMDSQQREVNGLAYSPDGTRLASVGDDGTARLWHVQTGEQLIAIPAHDDEAYQVVFASNGQQLITCGKDPVIRVWDVATGSATGTFVGHTDDVEAIALSPDGHLLASAGRDRTARLWRTADRKHVSEVPWELGAVVSSVAFSSDGAVVAAGDFYGQVLVAAVGDVNSLHSELVRLQNPSPIQSLVFLGPDNALLVGDRAGTLTVFALGDDPAAADSTRGTRSWRAHTDRIYGLAVDSAGELLASISRDGTARLWPGQADEHAVRPLPVGDLRANVDLLGDGASIVTVARSGEVERWSLDTRARLPSLGLPVNGWENLAAVGKDRLILVDFHGLLLWDTKQNLAIARRDLPGEYQTGAHLFPSPSGDRIAILSGHQEVPGDLLEARTLDTIAEIPTDYATKLAWHPSGQLLAVPSHNEIRLWDVREQRFVDTLPTGKGNITSLDFSPDGRLLAIARDNRSVAVWDVQTGRYVLLDQVAGPAAIALNFTPDGRTLLVADTFQQNVLAWHVPTGRSLGVLAQTTDQIIRMRLTPDGRAAVVVTNDQVLLLQTR